MLEKKFQIKENIFTIYLITMVKYLKQLSSRLYLIYLKFKQGVSGLKITFSTEYTCQHAHAYRELQPES